jgi:hypothetical protein
VTGPVRHFGPYNRQIPIDGRRAHHQQLGWGLGDNHFFITAQHRRQEITCRGA